MTIQPIILAVALLLFLVIPEAWVSRMCGGGKPKLSWGLDQWIYAIPHGIVGFMAGGWWGIAAYLGAVVGKRAGHGQWFDLGTTTKITKPEKLDWIVRLFRDPDPNTFRIGPGIARRDAAGLAISGMATDAGVAIVLACHGLPLLSYIMFFVGSLKWAAYWISKKAGWGTEGGEILTGAFDGLGLSWCIFWMLAGDVFLAWVGTYIF